VVGALRRYGADEVTQMNGIREDVEFRLPPELRLTETAPAPPPAV
jgi:hypothetical protein